MTDAEFIIYTHRPHPWQSEAAESIVRMVPSTVCLTVIREPGTAAQNSNRALDMCRSRYLFLLDEDVELFQVGWAERMLEMAQLPDFGVGSCAEIPVRSALHPEMERARVEPVRRPWLPGYVLLFDMLRCAGIRYDEQLPGPKGGTDADICAQIRLTRGLGVWYNQGACVIHKAKPLEAGPRTAAGFTTTIEQEKAYFPDQMQYLDRKWGLGKWQR